MPPIKDQIQKLTKKAKKDKDILAVILFGSYVRDEASRDIDVCLVVAPSREETVNLAKKGLEYIGKFDLDIHTYQELPLYIQIRVLKEGKVLLCKDEDALYDISIKTSRYFEDYYPRYRAYLESVALG
ncbi:MAG: nucleotidyltransferase domain-containing protein [Candidatus Hydrothermarchaeales archaeon]